MTFKWVEGQSCRPEECTVEQAKKIGEVLSQIHQLDIELEDLDVPSVERIPDEVWEGHIVQASNDLDSWGFSSDLLLKKVIQWSRLFQEAMNRLSESMVISHRDLDPKNVVWDHENNPHLIDWESAGYVNPMVELIEVALYWSQNHDGSNKKEYFQSLIQTYIESGGMLLDNMLDAIHGSLGSKLGWLEYNMRRSLGNDMFSQDERELGNNEVKDAVRTLEKIIEYASTYLEWIEEAI